MFKRKKRKKKKEEVYQSQRAVFKIPQFVKVEGLAKKPKFKPTPVVSPVFGHKVKDELVPENVVNKTGDVAERYDSFRDEKKISEEERIRQKGSKYWEFTNIHTDESREIYLGSSVYKGKKHVEEELEEEPEIIKPIGFGNDEEVEVASEFEKDLLKEEEKPIVHSTPETESPFLDEDIKPQQYKKFSDDESFEDKKALDEEKPEAPTNFVSKPIIEKEDEIKEPELTFDRLDEEDEVAPSEPLEEEKEKEKPKSKTITKKDVQYKFPSADVFSKKDLELDDKPEWLLNQIKVINMTLAQFGVEGHVAGTRKGPTVTRFEIELEPGVSVKKVSGLQDNLMMALASNSIRIEAPIPGKPYVGIEVPNEKPEIVWFGNVANDPDFLNDGKPLRVALGIDIDGEKIYTNIQKMPHCLIAGATNSGKSVCVNTILISLLLKNHPDDLRLILVDPKMVELAPYNDLPHLITPVITDAKIASSALKWAVDEMEKRYVRFSKNQSRDIKSFNEKVKSGIIDEEKMPYIVIVIDELADLMMVAAQDVEDSIQRITQKARAAGIHLLIATQRPTTDVVKGTIKANIPSRMAFRVSSFVDSTTILDQAGAESLLGKGDMLFKEVDQPHRLQGAFIPDEEIYAVTDFIRAHSNPRYVFEHEELKKQIKVMEESPDEMFPYVARFVVEQQEASINAITTHFSMGFNRAKKIVDTLEKYGVIGPSEGTKAREVLVTMDELEEILGGVNSL